MISDEKVTQTETANRCFLERVQQIPNVIVYIMGGEILAEQSFIVEVPSLWDEAADRVYELEGEIYRAFPRTQTHVRVRGKKEENRVYEETQTSVNEGPS